MDKAQKMDWEKHYKDSFQANLLDGDDVKEGGGSLIDAEEAFNFSRDYFSQQRKEIILACINHYEEIKRDWEERVERGETNRNFGEYAADKLLTHLGEEKKE